VIKTISVIATLFACSAMAAPAAVVGKASFYELRGRTASGAHAGPFTAAHRSLPFGAKVRVTNLANQRSVVVVINDRGPFTGARIIDVSGQAADALGFRRAGVAMVKVEPAEIAADTGVVAPDERRAQNQ
jgi:rare lipoprotein A